MDIANLFECKAKQLFWKPVDPSHVAEGPAAQVIPSGQAYFSIRLCEMYLAFARKLWHQIYPMVHCFTQFSGINDHAVVSPVEFTALGDVNLDRLVNVDMHLSGPNPYDGGDVNLIAGLYAVPGHDSAKALIDVVSSLSSLDPTAAGRTVTLSSLIESGVGSILGLDQATLHLGVRDTFHPPSHPLTSGYFVGIGAPDASIDAAQLWVVDSRLRKGKDAAGSVPYSDHDYMLISIERLDARDDWQQLTEVADYRKKFANLVGDTLFTAVEKQARVAALWPAFIQALADSPALIDPDRSRIAALVSAELLNRLRLQTEGNPFLRKIS